MHSRAREGGHRGPITPWQCNGASTRPSPSRRQDPFRTVKSSKFAELKPKKKCCRSKPRCKRCPLVVHKVLKAEHMGIRGQELEKVYKRARRA